MIPVSHKTVKHKGLVELDLLLCPVDSALEYISQLSLPGEFIL